MLPLPLIPALFSAMSWAADPPPPCVDEAAVLEASERAFPSRYRDLMEMRDQNPDRFARMIHNTAHVLEDPQQVALMERLANAQDRLERAAATWEKAPEAQRAPLQADMEAAAAAVVDISQAARREHATSMREALNALNALIADTDNNRDISIQDEIDRVTP